MIYQNVINKSIRVVEFGNGSVHVNPTNNAENMVANGVLLYSDGISKPIGFNDDSSEGQNIETKDNAVFLSFKKVESIDVLIESLDVVKRGMIENKSVQQIFKESGS